MQYSGTPIFRTSKGNENWFEKIGEFEKSGVKLQCSTEERDNFWFELSGGAKK